MIPLYLCDPSGRTLQRLEEVSCSISRHIDQVGTLEVTCKIPRVIAPDYRIVVDMPGESETLWIVTDTEEVAVGDQRLLSVAAKDGKYLYEKRFVFAYNDTAQGYKIDYPQSVAAEIIDEQMISSAQTYRNVPGLQLYSTPGSLLVGFSAWEGEVAWKKLWDVFADLMSYGRATDNPFVVDLIVSPLGGNEFRAVVARRMGREHTITSAQLSRYGFSIRESHKADGAAEKVTALGSGDGSLALYSTYPTTTPVITAANPFFFKEEIVPLGNEDDLDALEVAAQSNYQERRPRTGLIIEGAGPVSNFWGKKIGYGDSLTILHNNNTYSMTVAGYSIQWQGAEEPSVSFVCLEGY